MNILVINWRDIRHPRSGGAEVRLHKIYEYLVSIGHNVILVSSQFSGCSLQENINGILVIRHGSDLTFVLQCMKRLKGLINKYQIDIVVEDYNKLPFLTPLFIKKPLLIQMHHLWKGSIFHETNLAVATLIWLTEQTLRFVYNKERFCVVSNSTKKELSDMGVREKNIDIIHNGVDLNFYIPPKNEDKVFKRSRNILWLSRIQKYKGIMDVCQAFKNIASKYPDVNLTIAGSGPYSDIVKRWIQKENLQHRIIMLGFVSEEEKVRLMQTSLFMVQSSYKEGWGLTVIETNACQTPVIANNAPGLCDSVCHRKTGLLYDFGSVKSLQNNMDILLNDQNLYSQLVSNTRAWAENFTWKKAALETLKLLENIVDRQKS